VLLEGVGRGRRHGLAAEVLDQLPHGLQGGGEDIVQGRGVGVGGAAAVGGGVGESSQGEQQVHRVAHVAPFPSWYGSSSYEREGATLFQVPEGVRDRFSGQLLERTGVRDRRGIAPAATHQRPRARRRGRLQQRTLRLGRGRDRKVVR